MRGHSGRDINDAVDDGASMALQTQMGATAAELQCQLGGTEASPSPYAKLGPVPDLNNRRFCRACQTTLPVESFPPGKRRYLCKRHVWLRVKRPSKERVRADPHRKLLSVLWKRCWNDAKTAFGHPHIALVQRDIAKVLAGVDLSDFGKEANSETGVNNETEMNNATGMNIETVAIALLPVNPTQLLSRENHVVVENGARRELLRVYRKGGAEKYVEALGRLD